VYFSFLFLFLFIVGVGRPSGGDTREHYSYAVAAISKKEGKLNIYIYNLYCVIRFNVYMLFCYSGYVAHK